MSLYGSHNALRCMILASVMALVNFAVQVSLLNGGLCPDIAFGERWPLAYCYLTLFHVHLFLYLSNHLPPSNLKGLHHHEKIGRFPDIAALLGIGSDSAKQIAVAANRLPLEGMWDEDHLSAMQADPTARGATRNPINTISSAKQQVWTYCVWRVNVVSIAVLYSDSFTHRLHRFGLPGSERQSSRIEGKEKLFMISPFIFHAL